MARKLSPEQKVRCRKYGEIKRAWLSRLLYDGLVSDGCYRLAAVLADKYLNWEFEAAWPSIATLAGVCAATVNTVIARINKLKELGYLDVTRSEWKGGTGGRGKTNRYRMRFPITSSEEAGGGNTVEKNTVSTNTVPENTVILRPKTLQNRGKKHCKDRHVDSLLRNPGKGTLLSPAGKTQRAAPPSGWPSEEEKQWARDWLIEHEREDLAAGVDDLADQCRNHHLAKGTHSPDWSAVFRTWVMRAPSFSKPEQRATGARSAMAGMAKVINSGRFR